VTSNNADGGYTVRPELDAMIDKVARAVTVMRSLATVRSINGRSLKKITQKSGAAIGGWGNETTAPTETGTPALVELELTPGTLWAEPRTTQEFLEDSDQNVEAWLADEAGIAFNEQEEAAFITSTTGTGVNRPRGFLLETPIANASYTWGSIGYIASGAAGAFATASSSVSPVDAFTDLLHALKPIYRANGRWLMADATVATIRKFKDGSGNLQWRPGVTVSEPYVELFLGKPIEYSDSMPAVASNSYSVAFADWRARLHHRGPPRHADHPRRAHREALREVLRASSCRRPGDELRSHQAHEDGDQLTRAKRRSIPPRRPGHNSRRILFNSVFFRRFAQCATK
jgi:HK97 family phage major capsid protein